MRDASIYLGGDFCLGPILDRLRAIGYSGYVSLELFNPMLWEARALQVRRLGRPRCGRRRA